MSSVVPAQPFPIFAAPNYLPVHAGVAVNASGSQVFAGFGTSQVTLFINVTAYTAGTLQYTIQEVDPGNQTTVIGTSVSSTVISGTGIQRITLPLVHGGFIKVSWVAVGATIPTVYSTLVSANGSTALVDTSGALLSAAAGVSLSEAVSVQGVTGGLPMPSEPQAVLASGFRPDPSSYATGVLGDLNEDSEGQLQTRSTVLTDEGSVRDDFLGSSLFTALTGTVTFTNGGTTLTGVGTAFLTQVKANQYIQKSTDTDLQVQVDSVDSDTQITLRSAYTGTTASVSAVVSNWATLRQAAISVASSVVSCVSGTANGLVTGLYRLMDYLPITVFSLGSLLSARIANQTTVLGALSTPTVTPAYGAFFRFTGTDNTVVDCVTCSSTNAADQEVTTVKIPEGLTSATEVEFSIYISATEVTFVLEDDVVAKHVKHVPGTYDPLYECALIANSAIVASTTMSLDVLALQNYNQLEITSSNTGDPLPVQGVDVIGYGTIASTTDIITVDLAGQAGASFFLDNDGSFDGTIIAEWSTAANSSGWNQALLYNPTTRSVQNFVVTGGASGGFAIVIPQGAGYARVRASVRNSGSAKCHVRATSTQPSIQLSSRVDGSKATYSAAIQGLAVGANPTDVFTLLGSASKVIKLLHVEVSGVQTTASQRDFFLIKRSTADTGGTSTVQTAVPHDSQNPPPPIAASAVVRAYTVNPTLGTTVGNLRVQKTVIPTAGSTTVPERVVWEFGDRAGAQAVTLRGTSEQLAVNCGGTAFAGGSLDISIEWTEE